MSKAWMRTAATALLALLLQATAQADEGALPLRPSYGKLEHVRIIAPNPLEIPAMLNPAIEGSRLYAEDFKYFPRDGSTWVRFTLDNGSVMARSRVTLERPILKDTHVYQVGGGIGHEPRVEVEMCLGTQSFKSELVLAPRNAYVPPLLLGGADLKALGTVDAQRKFTQEPACVPPQKAAEALPAKS